MAAVTLPKSLIDMHCHVFNASDLPAVGFVKIVVRERFEQQGDALLLLVGFLLEIFGGSAPSAADELAAILGKPKPPPAPDNGAIAAPPADPKQAPAELKSWLHLLGLSRRDMIAKLISHYTATGRQCTLMTPALVDFNAWLAHPEKKNQRLTDQVAVMGALARQPGPTRVHGFVGFDPIRAILAQVDRNPVGVVTEPPIDPHKLVRTAINKHGFLGVKLYPPMGFRALHNDAPEMVFPQHVKDDVNSDGIGDSDLGKLIDSQLSKLYKFCANNGVPILAHGYNSNQAGGCFGWRASPQYWREVIKTFSTPEKPLRICLAHFGRFDAHQVNTSCLAAGMLPDIWETIFGSILSEPGAEFMFADLSYFAQILDRSEGFKQRRKKLRDKLRSYIDTYDKNVEHLCFGSDWMLLGLEKNNETYHEELGTFLIDEVGLTQTQVNRVFFGNAVRFLGLSPGDQGRARLEKFYDDNNISALFPKLAAQA